MKVVRETLKDRERHSENACEGLREGNIIINKEGKRVILTIRKDLC